MIRRKDVCSQPFKRTRGLLRNYRALELSLRIPSRYHFNTITLWCRVSKSNLWWLKKSQTMTIFSCHKRDKLLNKSKISTSKSLPPKRLKVETLSRKIWKDSLAISFWKNLKQMTLFPLEWKLVVKDHTSSTNITVGHLLSASLEKVPKLKLNFIHLSKSQKNLL